MRQKILVTGARGFIGSHLVKTLAKDKENIVYCLSRYPDRASWPESSRLKTIKADICDSQSLENIFQTDFDIVFHCAAQVESNNLEKLRKVNAGGTKNICEMALKKAVRRMVYLSSIAVLSGNENVPLTDDCPYSASNNYGVSKIEAEKIVLSYREQGLRVCILRPPMVYGEDEPHMMKKLLFLLKHRMLPLINGGQNKLHLAYVENVVEAMLYALKSQAMTEGTYLVADNEILTVADVFACFCLGLAAKEPFKLPDWWLRLVVAFPYFGRQLKLFTKDRVYNTEKIRAAGFEPSHAARESLIRSARVLYYGA